MFGKSDLAACTSAVRSPLPRGCEAPIPLPEITVSSGVARAICNAAEAAGVPRAELLSTARVSEELLNRRDARVPRAAIYRLCEHTLSLAEDPALGLHWAEKLEHYSFELVGDLISRSATLRAGLQTLMQFLRLLSDEPSFEIKEQDGRVYVRSLKQPGMSPNVQRFISEVLVLRFWRMVCEFAVPARPLQASFEYPAPTYHAEYTRLFEGAEKFDQPFTGIIFDRELLDAPSPIQDEDVHGLLRSVAERRMLRLTDSVPFAARAREVIVKQGTARVDMEKIARSLGLSGRTLRRRLAAEGIRYDQVANEALAIIAKQLLSSSRLSIQEVSAALGFAHPSGFHRAFKRLTGMTPVEYRRQASSEEWSEGLSH